MFKKTLKAILYFMGFNGSTNLANAIQNVDEKLNKNTTLYCPDFITCPITENCGSHCTPNFMPYGVSQDGIRITPPCSSSVFTFQKAFDWHDRSEGNICYYESRESDNTTRDAIIVKNLGATFFADTSQQNLWVKADENINICETKNPKLCPFY